MLRKLNKSIIERIDKSMYGDFTDNWDNDMFRALVLEHLTDAGRLLDVGAGRGALPHMDFSKIAGSVVGVDPDPVVQTNPYLDEAVVALSEDMADLESESFDIVVCNNVLEHVPDATGTFDEVHRVLKPGGVFITKTPNVYHYMATIARFTPTSFHRFATKLRGRPFEDTFPTRYQANTRRLQRALAEQSGFVVERMNFIEGRPEYLRFSALTYVVGLLYERLVNGLKLDGLKIVIFTVFRKPQ